MNGRRWSHLPLDLMHRIAGSLDTARDLCNFERVSRACWWATLVSSSIQPEPQKGLVCCSSLKLLTVAIQLLPCMQGGGVRRAAVAQAMLQGLQRAAQHPLPVMA